MFVGNTDTGSMETKGEMSTLNGYGNTITTITTRPAGQEMCEALQGVQEHTSSSMSGQCQANAGRRDGLHS